MAQILANGEIVPNTVPPTGHVPDLLSLPPGANGSMQITCSGGDIGAAYTLEFSTNLLNWLPWTNHPNPQGTFSVIDAGAATQGLRFYRAVLTP